MTPREWQPISSASLDGTTIEVRHGKWAPYHARFQYGGWQPIEFNAPNNPTHWLPASSDGASS